MKQQISPVVTVAVIVGVLAVMGIVAFFLNSRPESSATAPAGNVKQIQAPPGVIRNVSPDQMVKQHMQQQGGGGQ